MACLIPDNGSVRVLMRADTCLSGLHSWNTAIIYKCRVFLEKTILFLPQQPYRCGQF